MVDKRGVVVLLFLSMIIISSILVSSVEITISTLADRDVEVWILDPNPSANSEGDVNNLLDHRELENVGSDGKLTFTYSTSKSEISLSVIVTKNGIKEIISGETVHKFENLNTGQPIEVNIIPGQPTTTQEEPEILIEETSGEEENITGETVEEIIDETEAGITGAVVSEGETEEAAETTGESKLKGIFTPTVGYIIGGILLLVVIVFVVLKMTVLKAGAPENIKVTKYSDMIGKQEEVKPKEKVMSDKDISKAEKKLKEAQEEIEKLRRLKEAEKKLEESRKEVERLRKDL